MAKVKQNLRRRQAKLDMKVKRRRGIIRDMSKLGDRIRVSRQAMGASQEKLGAACTVTRAAVSLWEKGDSVPTPDNMRLAADFLGVDFYWLLTGKGAPTLAHTTGVDGETKLAGLQIVGVVEAGVWREHETPQSDVIGYLNMPEDTRFPGLTRRVVEVSGDSVNEEIPHGGYAIFIDIGDLKKGPEDGQLVVVERIRHQGGLYETTIKEYRKRGEAAAELWPKSTNPKHAGPVRLSSGSDDSVEVRIKGIVVGKYIPM